MGMFHSKADEPLFFTVFFRFVEDGSPGSTFHRMPVTAGSDCPAYPADCGPNREGWDLVCFSPPSLHRVKQDEVVDVHYRHKSYTVRFADELGKPLPGAQQEIRHGCDAIPPVYEPPDGKLFHGWEEGWTCVTADRVIKARVGPKRHLVYFLDSNGKTIGPPQRVPHGEAATPPRVIESSGHSVAPASDIPVYHVPKGRRFLKWSRSVVCVTDDIFCVALTELVPGKSQLVHAVTFCDEEGRPLEAAPRAVKANCAVMPPSYEPRKGEGWLHTGWSHNLSCITQDIVVRAAVIQKEYSVRFRNEDGVLVYTAMVRHGCDAPLPQSMPPLPEGCVARRWQGELRGVTGPREIIEELERETFFVAFYDQNGFELDELVVAYGELAGPIAYEAPEGWSLKGWKAVPEEPQAEPRFLSPGEGLGRVTCDLKVYAQCEPCVCRVQVLDLRDAEKAAIIPLGSWRYGASLSQNDLVCLHLRQQDPIAPFRFPVTGDVFVALTAEGIKIYDTAMRPQQVFSMSLLYGAAREAEKNVPLLAAGRRREA
ncbi:MAG: hypothetical protein FWH26_00740 [Oscillospiraceae bacterium]|nr:hypothetical protein [Oscillospiraceae bacterium]